MVAVAEQSDMLTLEQASERYNVPVSTLRFWRDRGELTRYKRGRLVVVSAAEVERKARERHEIRRED